MSKSAIEWTEDTWNPVVGCSTLSPGCTNCYAMKRAARIEAANAVVRPGHGSAPQYNGTTKKVNGNVVWTGKLALAGDNILLQPLKRKKPTTYFVNSMGDLFHEDCPDEWIDRVFAVMALSPQHTFQVLTKRAKRMRDYLTARNGMGNRAICRAVNLVPNNLGKRHGALSMPLHNVWLGVSTERQQEADERIPELLATPAAVRFISAEPLLGPIDLSALPVPDEAAGKYAGHGYTFSALQREDDLKLFNAPAHLDWVIVGGESGPDARPMHPDWARRLREQCKAAGVPFFFKQWGESIPIGQAMQGPGHGRQLKPDFFSAGTGDLKFDYARVGKKAAGRVLDGMFHDEYPGAAR